MEKKQLYQDLSRLLDEIDSLSLETDERRRLHKLVSELEGHLDAPEKAENPQQLANTVDQLISHLEAEHPAFTGSLRRLLNALSSMGVMVIPPKSPKNHSK